MEYRGKVKEQHEARRHDAASTATDLTVELHATVNDDVRAFLLPAAPEPSDQEQPESAPTGITERMRVNAFGKTGSCKAASVTSAPTPPGHPIDIASVMRLFSAPTFVMFACECAPHRRFVVQRRASSRPMVPHA